jgi:predicted helicase
VAKGQCFPLYFYDEVEGEHTKRDAITDETLKEFQSKFNDKKISKEDIFYYVYGVLHSPEYRSKYESSLKKMLPRIPFVKDFWGFSKAGRELAEWHLNYETVTPYPLTEETGELMVDPKKDYRVIQMKFPKKGQKDSIIYNSKVTLTGIPPETYQYVVNGKPALEWVMERYALDTDKGSDIKNDPNDWSDDPRYIIDLVKRVVRVSVETVRIVNSLPKLELI